MSILGNGLNSYASRNRQPGILGAGPSANNLLLPYNANVTPGDLVAFGVSGQQYVTQDSGVSAATLATFPAPGAAGTVLQSNGTNWTVQSNIGDASAVESVDYANRLLDDSGGAKTVDWQNHQLITGSGAKTVVDWNNQRLYDTTSTAYVSVDWLGRQLIDASSSHYPSVDWAARNLIDATSEISIDWTNRILYDQFGHNILDFHGGLTNAVNYLKLNNNSTAQAPGFSCLGSDTNIGMMLQTKGVGDLTVQDGSSHTIAQFHDVSASAVNYLQLQNAATGVAPFISSLGSDANVSMTLLPKGTGSVNVRTLRAQDITDGTKGALVQLSSAVTNTTTTLNFAQSANRTVTFPDATGTLTLTSQIYYPTRAEINSMSRTVVAGNVLQFNAATIAYAGTTIQSPQAINDITSTTVTLAAGTYNYYEYISTNSDHGIMSLEIDGTTVGTSDGYSASVTSNVLKSITGIVIATSGVHLVRFMMLTKNAAASSYTYALQGAWFKPAADAANHS